MKLPDLEASGGATVALLPMLGMHGEHVVAVVIKQRFLVDRHDGVVPAGGAEVRGADEFWDPESPETSSVKLPTDQCPPKPATDVLVAASATAAYGAPAPCFDVVVSVGPVRRVVRAHGPRVWYQGVTGLALSEAAPVASVPLQWELAWGGSDASDPRQLVEEPRNPFGRGVARSSDALVEQPGPQIEDPEEPITGARHRAPPVGVAPIAPRQAPRRGYTGTMDEAWMRERMPLLPLDFDPRFYQCAPPEMVAPGHLRGGEPVELVNLSETGPMRFELPRLSFYVGAWSDEGGAVEHPPVMDTVLLLPNEQAFELTWRSAIRLPRPVRKLRAVRVHPKERV